MIPFDTVLSSPWLVPTALIMIVAALAHGTMGFGFPLISTPMIALVTDVETAIVVTLIPNLAINVVSIARGGNWRASIGRHWPIAVFVFVGAIVGTRILLLADPAPLKLLLALMIFAYLQQERLRGVGWSWLRRHPLASAAPFGLLAGVLSGTVNVAVPPLVIYFMALGVDAVAMTQILNFCFVVARATQGVAMGYAGHLAGPTLLLSGPLTLLSVAMLYVGMRLQGRLPARVYQGLLRKVLWAMAGVLALQVALHYLH